MTDQNAPNTDETVSKYHQIGYVVVTPEGPDDGGDFGPNTPGTHTAGIQEALNYALNFGTPKNWSPRAGKNVYICRANYIFDETIVIPPMGEHWRLDAQDASLTYTGSEGDAIRIDSLMNCELKFGYVVAGGLKDGACVRLKPENPFPEAPGMGGVATCSILSFLALVGSNPMGNTEARGVGLWLDASAGPIIWSNFFCLEVNGCHPGILCESPGGGISSNRIISPYNHECGTALQIGTTSNPGVRSNEIFAFAHGREGVRIAGQENRITLDGVGGEAGKSIVFESTARDNVVYATNLGSGVTNEATHPTNRISVNTPIGYSIETPDVPPTGEAVVNRNPHAVEISVVEAGDVDGWEEIDANGSVSTFSAGLTVGQRFICDPGDQVRLHYSDAPRWRWKALS